MTTNLVNDTRLADLTKTVKALGTKSAHSALAKPQMALAVAQARADGVIDDDAGASTYEVYLEGRRSVLGKNQLGAGAEDGGSHKVNVSKNTQIIKAAGLISAGVDFVDVMTRSVALRETLLGSNEKVKPTFDGFVDLARAQLKSPTAALTDDEIISVVRKKEAAAKDLVDKLIDTYKRLYKHNEEFPCQSLEDAIANMATTISEAGGEVPPMTKEEKEAASAMAYMERMGFKVVKADAE